MRVVGGAFSGRRLVFGGKGASEAQLRPTSDRVRESLFSIIEHGNYPSLKAVRVLDLFAGTGALGIEALSRGAARACFVENHAIARSLIRENLEALDLLHRGKIYRRDATHLGPNRGDPFQYLFSDPPYGRELAPKAVRSALCHGWLAHDAVLVSERARADPILDEQALIHCETRQFGDTAIDFFRVDPASIAVEERI
jgi:16S rRNA (guanine966-N2)-methyltransferase